MGMNSMNSIPDKSIYQLIRRVINFPYPQVCKHLVAGALLELLETHGGTHFMTSEELQTLAKAIVQADDDTSAPMLTALLEKVQ